MVQQTTGPCQLDLFDEALKQALGRSGSGEGGTGTGPQAARQALTASDQQRALTQNLMDQVASSANLNQAWKRVKANKGTPGVDGMPVDVLRSWIAENKKALAASLLDGSYQPDPVLGVMIPKPGGGKRQLAIPTVRDRLVQQAILQVLQPILDPSFSASSFGFRPGRSAHDALRQAGEYVAEGRAIVVDLDLEKFFDRVNHDILMARLARRIGDKRLLVIIRRFLEAGLMHDGVCMPRIEGTPQGGPLSPVLANLLLDDLDRELERRGHRFCRGACPRAGRRPDPWADDVNIYVYSRAAGERVMASISRFLERRLRLKVNLEKSAVAPVEERKFLGYRLSRAGRLGIAPKSLKRFKQRVRKITKRKRGDSLKRMIAELDAYLPGWLMYFRYGANKSQLRLLDSWVRRRLRAVRLNQCKGFKPTLRLLRRLGTREGPARKLAASGKGCWRKAISRQAACAMSAEWLRQQGMTNLVERFHALPH